MRNIYKGFLVVAVLVSVFIFITPLLAAEGSSGCPLSKEKKAQAAPAQAMPSGGPCMMMHNQGHPCSASCAALPKETLEEVKKAKAVFQTATQDLRMEMKSKRFALKSELAKKEPNADTALGLQSEISKLKTKFDRQKLEHFLKLKKIWPYAEMGCLKGGKGACMKGGADSPFSKPQPKCPKTM